MSAVAIAFEVIDALVSMGKQIREWVREGVDDQEILRRISDPSGVGADLIRRIRDREERGRDLLGRDPE